MKMRKITSTIGICLCLMFSILLPIQAKDTVTLRVKETETANELQLVLEGLPKTKSVSLNLKVNGNAELLDSITPSKELLAKGGRIDSRQDKGAKKTLDLYVTSKSEIDTNGTIVLGTIKVSGKFDERYTLSLNEKKTGIKSVSSTFASTTIAANADNLKLINNVQTIINPDDVPVDPENPDKPVDPENPVDPEKPVDPENPTDPENPSKPTDPENPTNPEDPSKPTDPENPSNPGNPENPTNPDVQPGTQTLVDGEFQITGNKQLDATMKLSVGEVQDKAYLSMVKKSLAKISKKYQAYNIDITKDGKSIALGESVRVRMPIPAGYDASKLKVYDIQENIISELAFTVEGNYIYFDIMHLGNFVIAETSNSGSTTGADTSDSTQRNLYIGLALASVISVGILVVLDKKKKLRNN